MKLVINRKYFERGTNGRMQYGDFIVCHTIELPWKENERNVSCIPEGVYFLKKRYNKKYGLHLEIEGVPNRSFILFHPANDALTELQGCIAPVSILTGEGTGLKSRLAYQQLKNYVLSAFLLNEIVTLEIKSL